MEVNNLFRFVDAQASCYNRVIEELKQEKKQSHWMWYIFPQLKGLGFSQHSQKYAISTIGEAKLYYEHPLLGKRLLECTKLIFDIENKDIDEILGFPDKLKFQSSMTLFKEAEPQEALFQKVLEKYFDGKADEVTLKKISK